jgi:uncharacterized protein (TIGR03435 family)
MGVAQTSHNGIFNMRGVPLSVLTRLAYNVEDFQIIGLPAWASVEGYDISAKASAPVSVEEMRPMLQALLAERFQFAFHRETKELPVYDLDLGKSGSKLERTTGGCMPDATPPRKPGEAPAPLKTCGGVRRMTLSPPPHAVERLEMYGVPVSRLVEILANDVGRTVIDKTGLEGDFNFRLDFAPMESSAIGPAPAFHESEPPSSPAGLSIFTALQSQLGLRLKPTKGPVGVMLIDRVERPSGN